MRVLTEGRPLRPNNALETVLGEFDARLVNATNPPEDAHTGSIREAIEVEPIEYLTYTEQDREIAHGLVIENPFKSNELHHTDPSVLDPEYVVVHLSDHELMDESRSSRY